MKIGYVNDFSGLVGGGELTGKYLKEHIVKSGKHIVTDILPEMLSTVDIGIADPFLNLNTSTSFIDSFDYFIINNIRKFNPANIKNLLDRKFIYFPRDVIPMSHEHNKLIPELYNNAQYVVFLSKLQCSKFKSMYGLPDKKNTFFYIPYFDLSKKCPIVDSSNKVCWLGTIYPHKGIDNVLFWAKENKTKVDFYGKGDELLSASINNSKYGNYKGYVSPYEIQSTLAKYDYFIHLPDVIEAFGRSVVEAQLSGCTCIIDKKKIGFYDWDFKDLKDFLLQMQKAQIDFLNLLRTEKNE